jgi:hypothetical protein
MLLCPILLVLRRYDFAGGVILPPSATQSARRAHISLAVQEEGSR